MEIDISTTNKLRKDTGDKWFPLKYTIADWQMMAGPAWLNRVSIFNDNIRSAAAKGLIQGIAKAQADINWMTGSASPWTPDVSAIRSKIGTGESTGGWSVEEEGSYDRDGTLMKTTFMKRDIVIGRHDDKKLKTDINIETEESFGGAISQEIRKNVKAVVKRANQFIGPDNFSRKNIDKTFGIDYEKLGTMEGGSPLDSMPWDIY